MEAVALRKFTFTLGRLLDYKDQVLETEKNRLGQLRARQAEIEANIAALERDLAGTDRRQKEEASRGVTVLQARMYEYQKESIRYQLKQQNLELKRITIEVDRQVQVVVAASQEVTGLEKLKEKQLEDYQKEVARDNENVIAEYISTKLVRESKQGS